MGARARVIYQEKFTGQAFARGIEQVYLDLVKGV